MLTPEGCRARRRRLLDSLDPRPDLVVLTDPQHLAYLANYYASPFVFRSQDAGAVLILSADGAATLAADNLCEPFSAEAFVDERVQPVWYRCVEPAGHRRSFLVRSVLEHLAERPGARIGYEASSLPAGLFESLRRDRPGATWIDVEPALFRQRRCKDADEIAALRASMVAAEAGHAAAVRRIKPGMSELDAYRVVCEAVCDKAGGQHVVYGDFASGPRTVGGGGPPTDRWIEPGDLFLLDFSVVVRRYRCDFANTFVVDGGRATPEQRRLFAACTAALSAGEALLTPGTPCKAVDKAVRDVFAGRGLLASFPHHSGHGIGLGHPEPPFLVPQSDQVLAAGDVVTLEPGQYVAEVGGMRFERNYLITPAGHEILSRHSLALEL
jgi:Xaa-Pro aminopeptidase